MNIPEIYWKFALVFYMVIGIAVGGTIIKGPTDVTVGLDRVAVFKCHVNKSDDEELHWLLDGQLLFRDREFVPYVISAADSHRFSVIGLSDNDYDLQITQVTLSDAREYTCKIQPKNIGTKPTEQSANLTIHRAPRKINPECSANGDSSTFQYETGSEVLFSCQSDLGIPDVELSWINQDNSSVNSTLITSAIYVQRHFRQNLSIEDTGKVFVCRSTYQSEAIGNLTGSCNIGPLDVLYSPESISIDSTGLAELGKTLLLTCDASGGNPQTKTYEWSVYPEIPTQRMYASANVLSIHKIIESDKGLMVTCFATNGIGERLVTNVTVNVTSKPAVIPTAVVSTTDTSNPGKTVVVPFSITYILIFILAGLIFLLGSVCIVMYLLIRKRRRRTIDSRDSENTDDRVHKAGMHKWLNLDDTGSIRSWRSEPGYSMFERGAGADMELRALKENRYKSQDNVYRMAYPGESVSQIADMSPLLPHHGGMHEPPRHVDTSDPLQAYYRAGSDLSDPSYVNIDTPPTSDGDYPSAVHYRSYSPYDHPYDPRRVTIPPSYKPGDRKPPHRKQMNIHGEVFDFQDNRAFTNYHTPTLSYGLAEAPKHSGKQRKLTASPVMRYKHRRQGSGGPYYSPSSSPKASPLASPVRRPHPMTRPLPQPESENDELQLEYKKFDDMVNEFQGAIPKQTKEVHISGDKKAKTNPDPNLRLWLYQQDINGKFLPDTERKSSDEEYDEDDVFVVVDGKGQARDDDEGYCSVHGYGSACGCDSRP